MTHIMHDASLHREMMDQLEAEGQCCKDCLQFETRPDEHCSWFGRIVSANNVACQEFEKVPSQEEIVKICKEFETMEPEEYNFLRESRDIDDAERSDTLFAHAINEKEDELMEIGRRNMTEAMAVSRGITTN